MVSSGRKRNQKTLETWLCPLTDESCPEHQPAEESAADAQGSVCSALPFGSS